MEKVRVGTLTIVIDNPHVKPKLTADEEAEIATAFLEHLGEKVRGKGLPFTVDFELLYTGAGCIKLKVAVYVTAVSTVLGTALSAFDYISKYEGFRKSLPALVQDVGDAYKCHIRGDDVACKTSILTLGITKQLYEVKKGDTLSWVVLKQWATPPAQLAQMMKATVDLNPKAFIEGDPNRLKAGSYLAKPTESMLKGIKGGRA